MRPRKAAGAREECFSGPSFAHVMPVILYSFNKTVGDYSLQLWPFSLFSLFHLYHTDHRWASLHLRLEAHHGADAHSLVLSGFRFSPRRSSYSCTSDENVYKYIIWIERIMRFKRDCFHDHAVRHESKIKATLIIMNMSWSLVTAWSGSQCWNEANLLIFLKTTTVPSATIDWCSWSWGIVQARIHRVRSAC